MYSGAQIAGTLTNMTWAQVSIRSWCHRRWNREWKGGSQHCILTTRTTGIQFIPRRLPHQKRDTGSVQGQEKEPNKLQYKWDPNCECWEIVGWNRTQREDRTWGISATCHQKLNGHTCWRSFWCVRRVKTLRGTLKGIFDHTFTKAEWWGAGESANPLASPQTWLCALLGPLSVPRSLPDDSNKTDSMRKILIKTAKTLIGSMHDKLNYNIQNKPLNRSWVFFSSFVPNFPYLLAVILEIWQNKVRILWISML